MFVLMMGFVTRFNGSGFRCALQVERRIDLVYGGGSVGLMGLVSQAVHDGGRHVLGFVFSLFFLFHGLLVFKRQASLYFLFNLKVMGNDLCVLFGTLKWVLSI